MKDDAELAGDMLIIEILKEINRLRDSGQITREEADEMKVELMEIEVEEIKDENNKDDKER